MSDLSNRVERLLQTHSEKEVREILGREEVAPEDINRLVAKAKPPDRVLPEKSPEELIVEELESCRGRISVNALEANIEVWTDSSSETFDQAVAQLMVLGEIEICQLRGTGPRVRLKHRRHIDDKSDIDRLIWECYIAKGGSERIAERHFATREQAVRHLREDTVADVEQLEPVPYLDGVWSARTSWQEGYGNATAVVRAEPVYTTKDERSDAEVAATAGKSLTDFDVSEGPDSSSSDGSWTYEYSPDSGGRWLNLQTGEKSNRKRRPEPSPEGGDGHSDFLSGWKRPPPSYDDLHEGQLLEVQLTDGEPQLAVVMNLSGDAVSIRTRSPDHLFVADESITTLAVEDPNSSVSVDAPEWAAPYRNG